jgi:hypothetical protein
MRTARDFAATGIARADAICRSIERDGFSSMQPGLFDRRAHFAHRALNAVHDDALACQAARVAAQRSSAALTMREPRLRLVLVPHR